MSGAIRFLEQLAPAAATAGAHVYAPVPPRFAPFASELQPDEEQRSVPAAPDAEVQSSSRQSAPRVTPTIDVAAPTTAAAERTRSPEVSRSDSARGAVPAHASAPVAAAHATPMNASATPLPLASPAWAASSMAAPRIGGSRPRNAAPSVIESAPSRRKAEASHTAVVRPPLRERTVAQVSAPPRSEPHPVVHVTIDRIEVRAPAARPAASAGPKSKPRTPSSKSLSDYLRERDRAGGSAP